MSNMDDQSMHEWWLEDMDTRLRITMHGLLVGRSVQCDLGVRDERVSRRHLLVRLDGFGPMLELLGRNGARVNGKALRPYERRPLADGDRISIPGRELGVLHAATAAEAERRDQPATLVPDRADQPRAVRLQHLPSSGGRLVLRFPDREVAAVLAERRFDCVYGLLCPPAGQRPGDWVSDDVLAGIVWPRDRGKGRVDVNVLLSRLRKDLVKQGLHGQALIQRERGCTRFALAPGASVSADDTNR